MTLKYETILEWNTYAIYHRHGERHRIGGPASMWTDGDRYYYQYGIPHRLDGPARIYGVHREHYIHGVLYTKAKYEFKIRSTM